MSWWNGPDPSDGDQFPWDGLPAGVRAAAFWGAVALPVAYVPLFATGLDTTEHQLLLIGLLAVNVVVVVLGHRYRIE